MPFPPSDFPLDGFQNDIAKRAFLLACITVQLVMQLFRYVFDLNTRHAGDLDRVDGMLASYDPNCKRIKVQPPVEDATLVVTLMTPAREAIGLSNRCNRD